MSNLAFAWRQLRLNPGFTTVAVLTLALGIGANTAMFNLLDAVLFQPLPYPDSGHLVRIFRTSKQSQNWPHSPANVLDHQTQNTVFESSAAFTGRSFNSAEPGQPPERLAGILATGDFFRTIRTAAILGRVFTPADDQPGAEHVAVISHGLWQRRFGGDTNVLGRTLRLDGENLAIIGVMPPDFGRRLWKNVDVWKPFGWTTEQRGDRGNNWLDEFARLKPGVSLPQAQAEMTLLAARLAKSYPDENSGIGLRVVSLLSSLANDTSRRVLWLASGLTLFVLLIGCANLANLFLARMVARERELAIRAALGAGRARLAQQLLGEGTLLALLGGGLGLTIGSGMGKILARQFDIVTESARFDISSNIKILAFSVLCMGLTVLLFGTLPAWLASRASALGALRQSGRSATAGLSHHRLRHLLIVGEVALALVLLAGAGLFLRGLKEARNRDPGWQIDGLLSAQLGLTHAKYEDAAARHRFAQQLEQRLAALPGVRKVALSSTLPVFGSQSHYFAVEGRPLPAASAELPLTYVENVSPDYFSTLGIRLLEGRAFEAGDTANHPDVTIINATMARHYWPGQSAVGHRLGSGDPKDPHWEEIVGVVEDIRYPLNIDGVDTSFQHYRSIGQSMHHWMAIELRLAPGAGSIASSIRHAVAEIDPELSVTDIDWVRDRIDHIMASAVVLGRVLGGFAGLGVFLAALGIYGVISYSVAQRTAEFGLRMALGATRGSVLWLVLRPGLRLASAGALIGLAGAIGVARLLALAAPEIPCQGSSVVAVLVIALLGVAAIACWLPARRATLINPMEALRHE